MWTNYPNMPTGAQAQYATYEKLVDFAKRHNILIVNDNPYSFICNEQRPISLLQVPGAKDCCIEFNSMSKSHNMPGWRVGMLATNAQFVEWILKVKSNIVAAILPSRLWTHSAASTTKIRWECSSGDEFPTVTAMLRS